MIDCESARRGMTGIGVASTFNVSLVAIRHGKKAGGFGRMPLGTRSESAGLKERPRAIAGRASLSHGRVDSVECNVNVDMPWQAV